MPIGGKALDLVGVPLPEEAFRRAKQSDGVLFGAAGWYMLYICIKVAVFIVIYESKNLY